MITGKGGFIDLSDIEKLERLNTTVVKNPIPNFGSMGRFTHSGRATTWRQWNVEGQLDTGERNFIESVRKIGENRLDVQAKLPRAPGKIRFLSVFASHRRLQKWGKQCQSTGVVNFRAGV
ncbi:hypothetical protein ACVWXO_000830 [Bradyrhizobium sp. LM2.7]